MTIFEAIKDKDIEAVKQILEADQEVLNSINEMKLSPLSYAASNNNLEVVKFLIAFGAKVDDETDAIPPLFSAVAHDNLAIAEILLKNGANPNQKDSLGNTTLHVAAENTNLDLLKLLIDFGGDVNAVNNYNWSVMHSAAYGIANHREQWAVIEFLLKAGAKANKQDDTGLYARDVFYKKDWSYAAHFDELLSQQL